MLIQPVMSAITPPATSPRTNQPAAIISFGIVVYGAPRHKPWPTFVLGPRGPKSGDHRPLECRPERNPASRLLRLAGGLHDLQDVKRVLRCDVELPAGRLADCLYEEQSSYFATGVPVAVRQ